MFGALLYGDVLISGPFNNYTFVFYFFFILEKSLSIYGLLKSLLAYFKKTPINPIYSGLDIMV